MGLVDQLLGMITPAEQPTSSPVHQKAETDRIIDWTIQVAQTGQLAITTSFGMEGCVLIDMYGARNQSLEISYLDTGFWFDETYALRDQLIDTYSHLKFVNAGTELTPRQQDQQHGENLWETNRELCCRLRKTQPMAELLKDKTYWVTALTKDHEQTRGLFEQDIQFNVLKINPLAGWQRAQIWEYVQTNNVPYNPLHEKGYSTIGCKHCTVPVQEAFPGTYSREGRWPQTEEDPCGLHGGIL